MLVQAWSYGILMFVDIVELITQLYFIIAFTDLESDYINPMELCETMEKFYPIEVVVQAAVTIWLLLIGEFKSLILTVPCTAFNAWRYTQTQFQFDATLIFRKVRGYRIESFVKLIYYFGLFCYFLYAMIWCMVVYSDME